MPARDTMRRVAGMAAECAGARRWPSRDGWRAVLFHHICDGVRWRADSPFVNGLGVSMEYDAFVRCVRRLARDYDVVSLDAVLQPSGRRDHRRRLLLCFDDAYASVAELAAPVLAELGLPWCFFINPGLVGNTVLSADNAVAYVVNTHGLAPLAKAVGEPVSSVGDVIHRHFATRTPSARRALVQELLDALDIDQAELAARERLYLEADDVRQLADSGVEIGNHTADHVHCRGLDEESAREQLVASAEAIATLTGRPVRGFAYPYGNGRDRTPLATSTLRRTGHECAFLVHNRPNTRRTDPFGLYRVSIDTADRWALAADLEVFPRLRAAKAVLDAAVPRKSR